MHWIIQDNLYHEDGFTQLAETMHRLAIPHDVVKVVPFSHEMIPDVNPTGPVMVCGSTTLAKIAVVRGWTPGSFLNENHDYRVWREYYGENLLNFASRVCTFEKVTPDWSPFFIRPCEDSKTFAGQVMDWEEFSEWQHKVIALKQTYSTLDANTMVTYSPVQTIRKEYRFFVVDGRVVTGSLYKMGSRVVYQSLVDDGALAFAQTMVDLWQPARAFVIDIALLDDEVYKIIEINCINSAGFYAIDVAKFVGAIEAMAE